MERSILRGAAFAALLVVDVYVACLTGSSGVTVVVVVVVAEFVAMVLVFQAGFARKLKIKLCLLRWWV